MLLAVGLLLGLAASSQGVTVEGFESGTFGPNEAITGDAGIQNSYFGINATEGSKQLLLTTINSTSGSTDNQAGYTNQSGNNSVPAATLASFFGVSTGAILDGSTTGKQGSGFTINLGVLTAGQTISFDYDFMTQEPNDGSGNKDFAFYTLQLNSGTPSLAVITDVLSAQSNTPGSSNPFGSQTNYLTMNISITQTGTYSFGLGMVDAGNPSDDSPSALLVDNINVNAVPEPSSILLLFAGTAVLVGLQRVRRHA